MAAEYIKFDTRMLSRLESVFQEISLVQNFWTFHNIVVKYQIGGEKTKTFSYVKQKKKKKVTWR